MISDDFSDDIVLAQYYGTLNDDWVYDDIVEEVDNDNPIYDRTHSSRYGNEIILAESFLLGVVSCVLA